MEKQAALKRRSGGPRTANGKNRSRLNATKHGRYSKQILTSGHPQQSLGENYSKILSTLVDTLKPTSDLELNWLAAAAEAKAREAGIYLWEAATIRMQIDNVHEKYQRLEIERYEEQSLALELEKERDRLKKEIDSGFDWQVDTKVRLSFLGAAINGLVGDAASVEFEDQPTPEARKACFLKHVPWDSQRILGYLINSIEESVGIHQNRASELTQQIEHAKASGQKEREIDRASILSGDDAEFVRSSLASYRRQYDKAIENIYRFRAAAIELAVKEHAAQRLLGQGRKSELKERGD
jgi:hypothetical protein